MVKMKPALQALRRKRVAREWLLLYFWLYLCWCEGIVRANSAQFFWTVGVIPTVVFSAAAAMLLYTLCGVFPRAGRVPELTAIYLLFIFYASQLIYNYKFHFFYSVFSLGNGGQILEFWEIILHAIWVKAIPLLLMLAPAAFLSGFGKLFCVQRIRRRYNLLFVPAALAVHILAVLALPVLGKAPMSPYDLYHNTNDLSKGALQLGLLPAFRLDAHRLIFGFDGGTLIEPEPPTDLFEPTVEPSAEPTTQPPTKPPVTEPPEPTAEPEPSFDTHNMLDIDFDALAEGEENETVLALHNYFREQIPTRKNEKTGMFAGCNLIEIVAEGFSYLAIDPELTPTLYRLQTEGFQFPNFYTAYWGVSTSDGEYVTLTGTIPKSGTWSMSDSADNAMPLTMAQQLKKQGYGAYAFHDHLYTYYHRDRSHPNLGYIYKAVGNGLEITDQWPESDVEMIDVSTADYVGNEPFHTYYMTVSGHLEYSFGNNSIADKNRALVEDLPYSEPVRAYLACQIELDRAVELLLERLEEAGVLENTVIVLTADHYPYGLTVEQQSELAGHALDTHFELYRNACIIYRAGMQPETVERPCSSLDLLPTLSNLFGLEFDSRLYMGQDIFSDAHPLVVFSDHSWLTEEGSYYTITEEALPAEGCELTEEDIQYYNDIVANKFLVSQWVLEEDYWRILFGDNLPPDEPQTPSEGEEDLPGPTDPYQ